MIQKNRKRVIFFLVRRKKVILVFFISLIISNLYFNFKNYQYKKVYEKFPRNIKAEAVVISDSKETEYYYSYNVKIENKKFILYVKKGYSYKLKYGMSISLEAEYSEPEESRNFKGFNYKEYLKTQKTYGILKAKNIKVQEEDVINPLLIASNNIRNRIIEVSKKIVPKETSGLLIGILIGDRTGILEDDEEAFRRSSLTHILAISGSHITYIILGVTFILNKSKVHKRWSYILAIITLIIFMFITNFSPTIVRACIMGIIMLFAKVVYRKLDLLTSISLSFLIILLDNPFSIKDLGVQLSYLGTLGIIYLNLPIKKFLSKYMNVKIAEIVAITLAAQIMVLPILVMNFNNISTLFLISNLLAVPISGVIILLGYANVFLGIISLEIGKIVGFLTHFFMKILILIAKVIASVPYSTFYVATPSIIIVFAYYALVLSIYKKKYVKFVTSIFIFLIIFFIILSCIPQNLRVNFIDVGQRRLYFN